MVGCSSNKVPTLEVKEGVIYNNGKEAVGITEHTGLKASYTIDGTGTMEFASCSELMKCPLNLVGVFPEDMTKYKDALYFVMYHDTEIVLHREQKDGTFLEAHAVLADIGTASKEQIVAQLYNDCATLEFMDYTQVVFEDSVVLNVEGESYKIRPDSVVIPGIIKISTGNVTAKGATTSGVIDETEVVKVVTPKFEYYQHKDTIIQVAKGFAVSDLVDLK